MYSFRVLLSSSWSLRRSRSPNQTCVGCCRDQSSLLSGGEFGEVRLKLEPGRPALESHVGRLAVNLPPPAQRSGQQPNRIDRVALASVVLADKDRQVALQFEPRFIERSEITQPDTLKMHLAPNPRREA